MDDAEIAELRDDPEMWDYEHPEYPPPVENPVAVVAVRFDADDFTTVARCADELGMKLTEFVREAALEKVANAQQRVS